jgi:C4-dicarboxylate-specific signal transduction histidine kinase
MTGAVGAAVWSPESMINRETLAGGLALVPALLLAQYRRWPNVSLLLAAGLVILCGVHLSTLYFGTLIAGPFLILFVLTPYIAIALGAGWVGEVRRYKAELRTTELQLIQAEKLESLGRMAAGIAHEVKNPLMIILTGIKVLSKRVQTDEQTQRLLQDMTEAVNRADKIVAGLLAYSRDRDLDVSSANLNAVVESALLLVKHDIDRSLVSVDVDLDRSIPDLRFDEFKIQQVLVNILTNAIHAVGHAGRIAVRTSLQTAVAIIQVDDSGPGIPEAHLTKIFEPFFTTKPTGIGTGLGLSISKKIVEMHGGTIDIGNRAEGGAQVTIALRTTLTGATV